MSEDYSRLEDILQPTMDELDAIASRGGVSRGVPTGIRDLDELTNGLQAGQMIVIAARPGVGKALALDTPIATPTGWTTMGEVQVGDQVMGSDGRPTTVVAATDVMTERPCYEVHFSDGSVIVADAQHQWLTETRASRRSAQQAATGYNGYRSQQTFAAVRTTEEIARTVRCATKDARLNHSVTNAAPLELPAADLLVPPYTLGVWLGDGRRRGALHQRRPEIAMYIEAEGLVVVPTNVDRRYALRLPARRHRGAAVPDVRRAVRPEDVAGADLRQGLRRDAACSGGVGRQARAPTAAALAGLRSARLPERPRHRQGAAADARRPGQQAHPGRVPAGLGAQRRALLAGLLDTDGTVAPSGVVQFAVTSRRLAEDTRELIAGLGYRVRMTTKRYGRPRSPRPASR